MIITSKQADYALVQKLAAVTHIPKKDFVKEYIYSNNGIATPVGFYSCLDEHMDTYYFYSAQVTGKLNIMEFLDSKAFTKCETLETFKNAIGFLPEHKVNFAMSLYAKGMVWIIRHTSACDEFRDRVGILASTIQGDNYVIQPVKAFLKEQLDDRFFNTSED